MSDAVPFAVGRDADVFEAGEGRVLRRYRDGFDTAPEAALMAYVASHGYPVPTIYESNGPDLVMERLDGPTMIQAIADGSLPVHRAGQLLAELHNRLHQLPARASEVAGDTVLHRDLHPYNVLLTERGPMVIDWITGCDGPADLDAAMTAVILAQVAVDDDDDRNALARELVVAFLQSIDGAPLRLLDDAIQSRHVNFNTTDAERVALPDAAALLRQL